jgi:hypothetical protein
VIAWLIIGILLAVIGLTIHIYRVNLRARRSRRSLRHVIGIEEWWGKR